MSQCKSYDEKPGIDHSFYLNVAVSCGNCKTWDGERCGNEAVVVASQDPELVEPLKLCDW